MKKQLTLIVSLCLLALVSVSCQKDLATSPGFGDFDPYSTERGVNAIPQDIDSLAAVWTASNHSDWDVISGTINPTTGGSIVAVPDSWPAGYSFSISVPAGALPDSITDLELHVPEYQDNPLSGTERPAVYKLEPDLQCLDNKVITVTVCYPPWLPSADDYDVYCIFQTGSQPAYGYSDQQDVQPQGADKRKDISFTTGHFSRWNLEHDK